MAKYRYAGPGPHVSGEGEITRPGDEREFGQEPDWGPWELLPEEPEEEAPGGQQQSAAGLAPAQAAADGGQPIVSPLIAPPATAEGM